MQEITFHSDLCDLWESRNILDMNKDGQKTPLSQAVIQLRYIEVSKFLCSDLIAHHSQINFY